MRIDARTLPYGETIDTEVCIVGTGPAGLTLARELINQDFQVCILESGGLEEPDPDTVSLGEVETDGDFVQVLPDRRNRRFGGNSRYWAINIDRNRQGPRLCPLDEVDFEQRDWLPHSGWPFDRSHLLPFYERAQAVCQLGPFAYRGEDWADEQSLPLPFKGDRITTKMFQFAPADAFYQEYRDQIDRASNITTYLYANAVELETDEAARTVTRVRAACLGGKQFWVSAKIVILAAGGVESTHLLLLSNQVQKTGLGNEYDQVGRYFMDHPLVPGGLIIPSNPNLFNQTALYDLRKAGGIPVMAGLGLTNDAMRREQVMNMATWIFPRATRFRSSKAVASLKELLSLRALQQGWTHTVQHLETVVTGMDDIAASAADKLTGKQQPFWANLSTGGWSYLQDHKEKVYGVFEVLHMTEQAPDPDNRIVLSNELDKLGRRKVRMQTRWLDIDIEHIKRSQDILAEEIVRAGLGYYQIERNGDIPLLESAGASHHMGTTRMHLDPKQGVVDEQCRVHSTTNLYIASSSVFPTGGCANPTLTIVALALRLADQVKHCMTRSVLSAGQKPETA
jgi:choline dehydrogenase-like flavoprotein